MSAVAVQQPPLGLLPAFRQKRHAAAPPASITAPATPKQARTPGIITLSKPLATPPRSSTRARKVTPPAARANDVFQPTPKSEPRSGRKSRSRPTSDEDEHETPSKPRGRRPNNAEKSLPTPAASPAVAAAKPRRNPSRTRQSPSPTTESDSPAPAAPAIQKPSGRLAKHRRGLTRSTPALCAAATAATSAPVPVPQTASASSQPSGLSRSAPLATPAMSQTIPARMRRTLTGSESAPATHDATPKDAPPSPSPPRRVREASWSQGPLTAPLNGGAGFPSRPAHTRSPSEALFNLSLDETDDEPQDMPILFGRSARGGDKVYAGGKFQNGPDTTTLPAPSFLSGF